MIAALLALTACRADAPTDDVKLPAPALQEVPRETRPGLSFGFVPQQSAAALARAWSPVLEYVAGECGCQLSFETAIDIPAFERRLAGGEYDLAYMNPYHYTVFHEVSGYEAFAKQAGKRIQGIIVVAKDAPYESVEDLAGLPVAFPAPAAFAATVLPLASFERLGFEVSPVYVSSHDSVYLSVARGLYPAGGGIERTFSTISQDVQDQLRVLWRTAEYTPHAFAAKREVPVELVASIQRSLTTMAESPEGLEALQQLGMEGIVRATDADWDDVRALDIRLLDGLENP